MSCSKCGQQAGAALEAGSGVPVMSGATQQRCEKCQSWVGDDGCQNPRCCGWADDLSVNEALKRAKADGPSWQTRRAASRYPVGAITYAMDVDKGPHDTTRAGACADLWGAVEYGEKVDKGRHPMTLAYATDWPNVALAYAKRVDKRPTPETREAAQANGGAMYRAWEEQWRLDNGFADEHVKWGFDHTDFNDVVTWRSLLEKHGISQDGVMDDDAGAWRFDGDGVIIYTMYEPSTGQRARVPGESRSEGDGFSGYIGIEGRRDRVMAVRASIRQIAYGAEDGDEWLAGDESPGQRGYI